MRLLFWPLCLINRHSPNRRRAHWDGLNFVSHCTVCGKAIRRLEKGGWRREWMKEEPTPGGGSSFSRAPRW